MKREIYLDANASHPLLERVKSQFSQILSGEGARVMGNASSLHAAGRRSRKLLAELRSELQMTTGLDASGWVFASGATEALNMILSTALVEGWRVWHSSVEHSAVLKFCMKRIPEARSLPVLATGELDLEKFKEALLSLDPGHPVLVVLQSHNNETGLPLVPFDRLREFRNIVDAHPELRIAWDAVQSLGKIPMVKLQELLSTGNYAVLSAHKIGAMSGFGAVWRDKVSPLRPLILGGAQEFGLRAGSEANWCALSFFEALREWAERGDEIRSQWLRHKTIIQTEVSNLPRLRALEGSWHPETLPNTVALIVEGIPSDLMLQKLDLEGICVSSGSACRSGVAEPSHVLLAMGLSPEDARSLIRISMPVGLSDAELQVFLSAIRSLLA